MLVMTGAEPGKTGKPLSAQDAESLFLGDLELAKREVRAGDPFEFIRLQWPSLLCSPDERQYFETDFRLDAAQVDILRHVFAEDHTECFIKGCTKYGKGFVTALAVNIWFDVFLESKIILTGPSVDHVLDNLFAEVVSIRKQMRSPGDGEIQSDQIVSKKNRKHFIIIANPKSGEGFSGNHSTHTLFCFDESSGTPDIYYDNSKKQARFIIALSNPRILSGWFRKGFGEHNPDECKSLLTSFGRRRLVTAAGSNTVNVRFKRLEKPLAPAGGLTIGKRHFEAGEMIPPELRKHVAPLIPSQIDYARFLDIMAHPDEMHRLVFGEGQFPREDAQLQVILSSWYEKAKSVHHSEIPVTAFGLDVAASTDGDETFLAAGGTEGCLELMGCRRSNVMTTAGWVLSESNRLYGIDLTKGANPVAIDYGGGLGKGIGDRLREQGVRVIAVIPNQRSRFPHLYENQRAELYGELGRRMNPDGPYGDKYWALPEDQLLAEELAAQEKIISSDGIRFRLIPKDKATAASAKTIKDKIDRSPDRSDAVTLLWRAVSANDSIQDYSKRPLVYALREEEAEQPPEDPDERSAWERNQYLREVAERMDARHDAQFASW